MPSVALPDAELHYEMRGDGPPLVLVAGLASDNASWAPVIPALAKRFTLIMPDNRGCGRTLCSGDLAEIVFSLALQTVVFQQ